jgi:hypothetical protein
MLPSITPTRPLSLMRKKQRVLKHRSIIYEPNLDEFEDVDDDCLGNPTHLGCIRVTSL